MKKHFLLLLFAMIAGTSLAWASDNFVFVSNKDGSTVGLAALATNQTLEYSTDGTKWNNMTPATTITINVGQSLYVRGKLTANNTQEDYTNFTISGSVEAKGNANYLWDYENPAAQLKEYCGFHLFYGCTGLSNISQIGLPSETLSEGCYCTMFQECTNVTSAPALPATTIAKHCYTQMFQGCSQLINAPELPATTLADYCYWRMFRGCTSLASAPALPATSLTTYCYNQMFMQTAITSSPDLPATTLGDYSYYQMFYQCSKLKYIKCLATKISATDCTKGWVNGVASSGTFVKNKSMTSWTTGANGMPSGWTKHNIYTVTFKDWDGTVLKTEQVEQGTSATAPSNPTRDGYVFTSWDKDFSNVQSDLIVTAQYIVPGAAVSGKYQIGDLYYNLDGTTLTASVTYEVNSTGNYSGLTSVNIPESITYNDASYSVTIIEEYAFQGCSKLTNISIPHSVTSFGDCVFENCTSLQAITLPENITSIKRGMFRYCSSLKSIDIPANVQTIGGGAFNSCTKLESISLKDKITSINGNAFNSCTSLKSIEIPSSVTTIQESAFYNCTGLTAITCLATNPPQLGTDVFYGVSKSIPLYVPNESINSYKSANQWKDFSKILDVHSGTSGQSATTGKYKIGDLYYYLDGASLTARVTSQNSSSPYWSTEITTADIPTSVTYDGITYDVTSIGKYAFAGCKSLTSVTIPNSVMSIRYMAFSGCSGLTSMTIPNGVTSIEQSAFSGCSGITSVTIPNSVTSIGEHAFQRCSSLTSVTIPNSVTSIGSAPFNNCSNLTKVILNSNSIVKGAYMQNIFGAQVTNYVLGDGITSIGRNAFSGCSNLGLVTIPNSVTSIGGGAFNNCSSLSSVTIPDSVTYIGGYAFCNCKWIYSVTIPSGVTSIEEHTFSGCKYLTYITISDNVTSIGDYAFKECRLFSVTIPGNTTSIGAYAFYLCRDLGSVKIPSSVTSIGSSAFKGTYLKSVTCEAVTPPTLGDDVFPVWANPIPLYVPAESVAAYKTAEQWKDFDVQAINYTAVEDVETTGSRKDKVIRNGQLFIIRGDKTYTVQGQEVK